MIKLGIFLLAAPGAQALSRWVVGRLTVSAIVVSVSTGHFGIRSYADQVSNFGAENPQPAHPPDQCDIAQPFMGRDLRKYLMCFNFCLPILPGEGWSEGLSVDYRIHRVDKSRRSISLTIVLIGE
jgi:hypothetical protein